MQLVLRLRPDVTIWFHQPQGLVRAWGPSVAIAKRYARLSGMRFARLGRPPGAATAWQHRALPASRAFVVELPPGELGLREASPHALAVLRLATAGSLEPVHAVETNGIRKSYGKVEALRGIDLGSTRAASSGSSARTALARRPPYGS